MTEIAQRVNRGGGCYMMPDLYPDIRERMASFNLNLLPAERVRRLRPMFAWQQSQTRLEDRPNPYISSGNGKDHSL